MKFNRKKTNFIRDKEINTLNIKFSKTDREE